ncbi:MAG TPA: hypothetical protein VL201_00935, partial [Patescibacteria group bacterium]|nr:hypothetical protein [Patescibacteria group bacterium]
ILEAGFAAEEVMFGVSTYSCHPEDSMSAYKAAEAIEFEGLDRTRIGKKQLEKLTEKSYMLKKRCHEEVKKLLEQYKSALIALIDALKKDATLSDNQVMTIIEQAMIEEEIKEEELADNASENKEDVIPSVQEVDVQQ